MQNIILTGFGFMGSTHAQIYKILDNSQVVAVVAAEDERTSTRERMEELNISASFYSNLGDALTEHDEADAVDVCVPTDLHKQFVLQAISADKHVFCEKPIALSHENATEMVEAAEEAGVYFQVGHCIRFWPEYMAFQEFLESGEAGRLLSFSLLRRAARPDSAWMMDENRSGGGALDMHIHDTDFVVSLLGTPDSVSSRGTTDETGMSHIFTFYDYNDRDVVVTAEGGWNYPEKWGLQMGFQAVFENGAVDFDSTSEPTLKVTVGDQEPEPLPYESPGVGDSESDVGNLSALGGYFNEIQYFIDCLESNKSPDRASGEQAARSLYVNLNELKSVRTEQPVPLTSPS